MIDNMKNKPIANSLKEFRKKAGLRQIDVAELLGRDCADRLSRWENGTAVPNVLNLFKLAHLYQVKPEELYPELVKPIDTTSPIIDAFIPDSV